MAGSKSNFLEAKLLDHVFGASTMPTFSTLYFALFLSNPAAGADTGQTEMSAGNYARIAVTNNTTNFTAATGTNPTTKTNATAISWVTDATADWGTAVGVGVFDAATTGNMLLWGDLSVNKIIQVGDTAQVAIGAMTVTED